MIVFYDEAGEITGYQTYPPVYNGDLNHLIVPDLTSLENKRVENGQLVDNPVQLEQAAE